MVGVGCTVVIIFVAATARVGRVVVIAVVARRAVVGYDGMCPV